MKILIKADGDKQAEELDVRFSNDNLINDNFVEMEIGGYDDVLMFSLNDLIAVVAAFRDIRQANKEIG